MEAIILAGGLGTRLASRLLDVPKAMAPIAGRPFLQILLEQLHRSGCSRVLLSVGHLHQVIEGYFRSSFRGMGLVYSIEKAALGTGGAIRSTMALIQEDVVLVLNGDTYLETNYAQMVQFHRANQSAMTMAIAYQADIARYGGIVVDRGRVVGFEEKECSGPGWINAGAYVLNKNLIWPPDVKERFSFESDFLMPQIAQIEPAAFKVEGLFIDIGIPADYDRAQAELALL